MNGTTPSTGTPVRAVSISSPGSSSRRSPRNRLIEEAARPARDRRARAARACRRARRRRRPDRCRPTSSTGASARRAMRMLTISVAARLISAGLPAPSMTTSSCVARSRSRLSADHVDQRRPPSPGTSRSRRVTAAAPRITTCGAQVALRLEQDRVHVDGRLDARRLGLRRLRAPDLAAVGGHRGVERHVLRLERRHAIARAREQPAERRGEEALADPRRRALDHETRRASTGRRRSALAAAAAKRTRRGVSVSSTTPFSQTPRSWSSSVTGPRRPRRPPRAARCVTASKPDQPRDRQEVLVRRRRVPRERIERRAPSAPRRACVRDGSARTRSARRTGATRPRDSSARNAPAGVGGPRAPPHPG